MEQGRIRWAIWGPIIGFILLFFILRYAVTNFRAEQIALEDLSVVTLQEVAINNSMELTSTMESEIAADMENAAVDETDSATSADSDAGAAPEASTEITGTATVTGTSAITGTGDVTGTTVTTETATVDASASITTTAPAEDTAAEDAAAEEVMTEAIDTDPGSIWVMNSLNGQDALSGWPIIAVIGDDNSITGSAGCNYYNASFTLDGDALSVAVPTSTRMMCPSDAAMAQENEFLNTLTRVTALDDQGLTLVLSGEDAEITLTSLEVLGNLSWLVDVYRDEAGNMVEPMADSAITANLDLMANSMIGLDGCNNYTADFSIQGDLIIIDAPVVTPAGTNVVACEPGGELANQAQQYLNAVQETRLYYLSESSLEFYDENHELLVVFTPAEE